MTCKLTIRGGIYHYRIFIPEEFRFFNGGQEYIRKTTGTRDKAQANRIMLAAAQAFEIKCMTAAGGNEWLRLQQSMIPGIVSAFCVGLLAEFNSKRAGSKYIEAEEKRVYLDKLTDMRSWLSAFIADGPVEHDFLYLCLRPKIEQYAKATLATYPEMDPLIPEFCDTLARQAIPVIDYITKTLGGELAPLPAVGLALPQRPSGNSRTYYMMDVYDRWAADQTNAKTRDTRKFMCTAFEAFAGKKPIDAYTRDDASRFKTALMDGSFKPTGKPVSSRTVENYLVGLKAIFRHAVDAGMLEQSPMDRVKAPERVNPLRSEVTEALTIPQLETMFGPGGPYSVIEQPRHCLPFLALFSGARLQECKTACKTFQISGVNSVQ